MNDILIQNNTTRNKIVEYIMNLLINVNKNIILHYYKNVFEQQQNMIDILAMKSTLRQCEAFVKCFTH